jgi:hypothetical protein
MFRNPRRDAASVGSVVRHWDVLQKVEHNGSLSYCFAKSQTLTGGIGVSITVLDVER